MGPGVAGFSGLSSLLQGNIPIYIPKEGFIIRCRHYRKVFDIWQIKTWTFVSAKKNFGASSFQRVSSLVTSKSRICSL